MRTVYRSVNRKVVTWSIFCLVLYLAGFCFFILPPLLYSSDIGIIILQSFVFIVCPFGSIVTLLTLRYYVDEQSRTFEIRAFLYKKIVGIDDISSLELCRNKKGGVKYFLVRRLPHSFSQVRSYDYQNLIALLTKLNPNILVRDFKVGNYS